MGSRLVFSNRTFPFTNLLTDKELSYLLDRTTYPCIVTSFLISKLSPEFSSVTVYVIM